MASNDGMPTAWGPQASPPRRPVVRSSSSSMGGPPATPGSSDWMAYASFFLGLLSCGFSCLTGVPAIVLGMRAFSRVQSGAKVFAVFGVALGGLTTLLMLFVLAVTLVGAASVGSLDDEVIVPFPVDDLGGIEDTDADDEDGTDE